MKTYAPCLYLVLILGLIVWACYGLYRLAEWAIWKRIKMLEKCRKCGGRKWVWRPDVGGAVVTDTCPKCKGTGKRELG